MNLRLVTIAVAVSAGFAAGVVVGCSHQATAATTQPVPVVWQDPGGTSCVPDLELADHNGAPIWWVLNCGGMWVGDDKLGVTGSSVTNRVAYLWSPDGVHGALVIDGQTLTGADIQMLHEMVRAHVTFADLRWLARHG